MSPCRSAHAVKSGDTPCVSLCRQIPGQLGDRLVSERERNLIAPPIGHGGLVAAQRSLGGSVQHDLVVEELVLPAAGLLAAENGLVSLEVDLDGLERLEQAGDALDNALGPGGQG